jgi:glycine/D-amino acid oxidase-like deaminating enzyme
MTDAVSAARQPHPPGRSLPRVLVSPARVIRTVVGLRPFRASGFRVEAERFGGKLLVHNYGHGGCGVTLSWGTASLAADLVLEGGMRGPVAVIGCGAVGLATARLLQARGCDVTIHARDLPPKTTSNVAGALWIPYLLVDEARRTAAFDAQFESAARLSHRHFQGLAGDAYGVSWIRQYFLSRTPVPDPWDVVMLRDLFPESRRLDPAEHPFAAPHVVFDRMLFIDPAIYLERLLNDFRSAGGHVRNQAFTSPAEVAALPAEVVVNCSGLGARELFGDTELTPIKGQLTILQPQPEIDYAWINDEDLYMFPRRDGILLGGTHQTGVESLEPDLGAERRILEGHRAVADTMR